MNPTLTEPTPAASANGQPLLPPEMIPSLDHLITHDDKPVDNLFVEKQQRLLTEPLHSNWSGPGEGQPFLAMSNVGLFYEPKNPAFVPDAMLATKVRPGDDLLLKRNHSYYVWLFGKVPDAIVEIVSDRTGGEDGHKLLAYARMGVPNYVIFDPVQHLRAGVLRVFGLMQGIYQPREAAWFPDIGLGLCLWQGSYENCEAQWLRWCDQDGAVIPTGKEGQERERLRAEKLRAQLRAAGIEPSA